MNMKEIQQIARTQGIKPGKLPKTTLIRTIQRNEGNFDCFATAHIGECNQPACLWREDCLKQTGNAV
jgi:hypothetical protein